MPYLLVTSPGAKAFRREIAGACIRIGRSGRSDLALEDPTVSRTHAEIVRRQDGYYIVDLGGKSGILVNGTRISSPALLRPGDQIRVGTTALVFEGEPTFPVEFTHTPLPAGAGTRILTPEAIRESGAPTPLPAEASTAGSGPGAPAPPPAREVPARAAAAMLRAISEADRELIFHRPIEQLLEKIMDVAQGAVRYERGVLMLLENDRLGSPVVRVPPGETGTTIRISRAIVDRVVGRQESVLTSDAQMDERFRRQDSVIGEQVRSALCVPLRSEDKVVGLLYVDSRREAGLFSEDDLRVLAHLASVAAVKIENARLLDQARKADVLRVELEQAAIIQESLLPARGPEIPGYQVCGRSIPCRSVGGDWFDYIEMPQGRVAVGLGDVAGRGLPAALLMCCFHSSLRALSGLGLSEAQTMSRLNRLLCPRFPSNRFVTSFYGVLDPLEHRMIYVNAGQDPPYLIREGAGVRPLPLIGMPLGLFEEAAYETGAVTFGAGDVLLCYSDGATDGRNPAEEMFGVERLVSIAQRAAGGTPEEIVSALTREIEKHHAGSPHEDDITLLVLKRTA